MRAPIRFAIALPALAISVNLSLDVRIRAAGHRLQQSVAIACVADEQSE